MKLLLSIITFSILFSCNIEESKIPDDVNYSIIDEERNEKFSKTNINVRLNKRVTENTLGQIAQKLKNSRHNYEKLWIFYLLPEMEVGKGAWATTHFKPEFDVEILGGTIDDELNFKAKKVTGEIIGKWIDNEPLTEGVNYLVKEDGKLYMKKLSYKDNWDMTFVLTKSKFNGLDKYTYENTHGEFYLIEENGNLAIYSGDSKFKEMKKL